MNKPNFYYHKPKTNSRLQLSSQSDYESDDESNIKCLKKEIKKDPFEVLSEGEEMERNIQDELNVLYEMKRTEEARTEKDMNDLKKRYETDLYILKERHKDRISKINNTIGKKFRLKEKINLKRALRYKEIEERNKLLPAMEVLKRNLNIVNENINNLNNLNNVD